MDGAFLDLEAEQIESEVDEYWRELYKIQKVFNSKLKRMQAERDERERERKKRQKRHTEEGGEQEGPEPEVAPPASLNVCNICQEQMKEFKVRMIWFGFWMDPWSLNGMTAIFICTTW